MFFAPQLQFNIQNDNFGESQRTDNQSYILFVGLICSVSKMCMIDNFYAWTNAFEQKCW